MVLSLRITPRAWQRSRACWEQASMLGGLAGNGCTSRDGERLLLVGSRGILRLSVFGSGQLTKLRVDSTLCQSNSNGTTRKRRAILKRTASEDFLSSFCPITRRGAG